MRKVLLATAGAVSLLLVLLLAWAAWLVRSLDTPEFERALIGRASELAGTPVRAREVSVGLLSGVSLAEPAVANPRPFEGDLLRARAFVLRYRLWPLLRGRLEVERLSLEGPRLALVSDARGTYNYERLGAARGAPAAPTLAASAFPLRLVLSRLAIEDGSITMTDAARARLLQVDGLELESALEVAGGQAAGEGRARARMISLGGMLLVRGAQAPARITTREVRLAPLRGRVGGGELDGEVVVQLAGGLRFTSRLDLHGANVETLLQEAGLPASLRGTLRAKARFEGRGGLATMKGAGAASIDDCQLREGRLLGALARVLDVPELARPDFDECRLEFTQQGRRLATPVVRLTGPAVRLAGHGQLRLDTGALDHDVTLSIAPRLFAKVTRRELRAAFETGSDGFASVEFRLTGTLAAPQTDLVSRVGRAAAGQAIQDGLKRIFGRR